MPADGTLVVVERILAPPNEGAPGKFSDLNMLVGPGGRERTIDDFEALFVTAGFRLRGEAPAASGLSVITATLA